MRAARRRDWVVYAKRPFAGPDQVLSYLARYTHRIAISNSRITAYDGQRVTFRVKDYRKEGETRYGVMTLSAGEFARRFLQHVVPDGLRRIRHVGLLANTQRLAAIAQAEAAVANYASAALDAWREVENALTADILIAQQENAQARALEEARFAEEIAERQFSEGTVNIFNLIDAQTRRLTAESQFVTARADRAINRINYHLALGGGVPVRPLATEDDLFDTDAAQ